VRIQEVNQELADGAVPDPASGALIAGLTEDGPAGKAGMLAGDVVLEFNGKPVEGMRALPRLVADTPPGEKVDVVVLREGKRVTLSLEIGLLEDAKVAAASSDAPEEPGEDAPAAETPATMFGLVLGPITDAARRTFSLDAALKGVLVSEVAPGSEAEKKSVKPGDVIVQVSTRPVEQPEDVTAQLDRLKSEGRRTVMLLVSGADKKLRFVSLRFEEAP
jgi:serine protease Do